MQSATVAQAAASQSGGVACAADSLSRRVAPVAFRAHLVVRLVTHPSFRATILLYDPGVRGLHASHPTNQPMGHGRRERFQRPPPLLSPSTDAAAAALFPFAGQKIPPIGLAVRHRNSGFLVPRLQSSDFEYN